MYKNTHQMIAGSLVVLSTVLVGYAVWSFYGRGKGGSAPAVVVEKA